MKYHVKLEPSTVYDKDVVIEAESMSEAVEIARNRHCGKEQVEVSYRPEWVEPRPADADEDYEIFEYNHQVFGECVDCKVVLFESHEKNLDNDWPYQYHSADEGDYTLVCHPCATKRKEVGNYCPFFDNFYRSSKLGCDKCQPECTRRRDTVGA